MTRRGILTEITFCLLLFSNLTRAEDATVRLMNKSFAYPRGQRCLVRLKVDGAEEVAFDVSGLFLRTVPVVDGEASYEIDTALLRAADYEVRARLKQKGTEVGQAMMPLTVGPPHDTERLPVWKWGHIGYEPLCRRVRRVGSA